MKNESPLFTIFTAKSQQKSVNLAHRASSGCQLFVNKTLLKHEHLLSFPYHLWMFSYTPVELKSDGGDYRPQSLKDLPGGSLQKINSVLTQTFDSSLQILGGLLRNYL